MGKSNPSPNDLFLSPVPDKFLTPRRMEYLQEIVHPALREDAQKYLDGYFELDQDQEQLIPRTVVIDKTIPQPTPANVVRFTYEELNKVSHAFNEKNDCAVLAICVVTNNAYPKIHEMFRKMKRRARCGTSNSITFSVLRQLGFKGFDVSRSFAAKTVRALIPTLDPSNIYLVQTVDHIFGVAYGECGAHEQATGGFVVAIHQVLEEHEHDPAITIQQPADRRRWRSDVTAAEAVWNLANRELDKALDEIAAIYKPVNGVKPPKTRRWWLALRARVAASAAKHGLKATTVSVELGKWQENAGYPMSKMMPDKPSDKFYKRMFGEKT